MAEFFKNFEPFCMNFGKFRNHFYEFCRFEDAIYSNFFSCDKNSKLDATKLDHLYSIKMPKYILQITLPKTT